MIRARKVVGARNFSHYLEQNCPGIKRSTAYNWIKLASSVQALGQIDSFRCLKDAYIAVGIMPEPEPPKEKQFAGRVDIIQEAVGRLGKGISSVFGIVQNVSLNELTAEHRQQIKERIQPLVELHGRL